MPVVGTEDHPKTVSCCHGDPLIPLAQGSYKVFLFESSSWIHDNRALAMVPVHANVVLGQLKARISARNARKIESRRTSWTVRKRQAARSLQQMNYAAVRNHSCKCVYVCVCY